MGSDKNEASRAKTGLPMIALFMERVKRLNAYLSILYKEYIEVPMIHAGRHWYPAKRGIYIPSLHGCMGTGKTLANEIDLNDLSVPSKAISTAGLTIRGFPRERRSKWRFFDVFATMTKCNRLITKGIQK